jgi:hypothetical protein
MKRLERSGLSGDPPALDVAATPESNQRSTSSKQRQTTSFRG